ncbi:MAG: porin family protein [Bacteroidetes bacterium]|nr:porin family protein [Bacteroidota bacterium]
MSEKIDFKANDEGGLDQLMRKTMAGYRVEPRPGLWKGISRKLLWKEIIHFNFTNLSPKFWIAGTTALLIVATTLYIGFPGAATDNVTTNPVVNIPAGLSAGHPAATSSVLIPASSKPVHNENAITGTRPAQVPASEKPTKSAIEAEQIALASVSGRQKKSTGILTVEAESAFVSEVAGENKLSSTGDNGLTTYSGITPVKPCKAMLLSISPMPDTIITIHTPTGILKVRKTGPAAVQFFSANLGITPEIAFYGGSDEYTRTNYWLNGGITYHISRFSIASGIDLGYVYDEGKYGVEYKSRDSIGYFNGVTSYTVGSNNEIIYNTQVIGVYDSLQHLAGASVRNRYTYLQVPLLLGYRFFESNRISLTFQAGPAVSVLLGSHKEEPAVDYRNARIISVDNNTPSRIQTNWQILANIYFEMRLNKKLSFYMEPSFKYYLKPMVTQENVTFRPPWTIGLGVGIQFNFGNKKTSP